MSDFVWWKEVEATVLGNSWVSNNPYSKLHTSSKKNWLTGKSDRMDFSVSWDEMDYAREMLHIMSLTDFDFKTLKESQK